jgi:hypothetical protein
MAELQSSIVFFYMCGDDDNADNHEYIPESRWEEFSHAAQAAMQLAAGTWPFINKAQNFDVFSRKYCSEVHPFRERDYGSITLLGKPGSWLSIGPWLQHLLTHQEEIAEINIYEARAGDKGQVDIFLEYTDKYNDSFLCSGLSNYSPERSFAYRSAFKIIQFVSFVTKAQICTYYIDDANYARQFENWLLMTLVEEYSL